MHPLERYLRELRDIRLSGAGVDETSYYPPLRDLLNEAGRSIRPTVRCIVNLKNTGAGIPDGGFFTADQFPRASATEPEPGQIPARGALEVKGTGDDTWKIAESEQVAKYLARYGQVLVTNLRDWVLVGHDHEGRARILEAYRLAESESAFWEAARHPRAAAAEHGEPLFEYLRRVLLRPAPLADPKDVAWFLASYARDARSRIEGLDLPTLNTLRDSLEGSLGIRFQGERGDHFFRSTLIQTLFYGIFSAWVLWCRQGGDGRFDWRIAAWSLRVPMIRALFHQLTEPDRLFRLGLVEVLDWAAEALNRVDRAAFFTRFSEEHAVQYFYEPFLEAFDPELRKELGVWYTPPEVVRYMVARVDAVLRDELGIADGLADPRVVVLDPCCGTGAYLVEVLHSIERSLRGKGDALIGTDLKHAATHRVFGFEILPAPFVVSHLQLGLRLHEAGASFSTDERAGVYLTNALTGWVPPRDPKDQIPILLPELATEREAAAHVKQDERILVILGNPPYNGFSGVAIGEERDLTDAYRRTTRAPKPQGQGLNDLYVRFFRMAERRIVEMSGRGVVCFISNYSWLDGLSFTGMRERYLEVFDRIRIDSLNGDKYRTGKVTPEGAPDPSIFSTEYNREGIQVGTAIATLVRTEPHGETDTVLFRNLWGKGKWRELEEDAEDVSAVEYQVVAPAAEIGFPLMPRETAEGYLDWPLLPELFPFSSPGVITARDDLLVDIDRERLIGRIRQYFDPGISHDDMARICPAAMTETRRFHAGKSRTHLLSRGILPDKFVRYVYRPFDIRWFYWEPETKLVEEKRSEFFPHSAIDTIWLSASQRHRREVSPPLVMSDIGSFHMFERATNLFPLYLAGTATAGPLFDGHEDSVPRPNLGENAAAYLAQIGADPEDLFHHAIAVMHAPEYRTENAGALRQDWPRIPLPASRNRLKESAELGRQLAALLNPEVPVPGVNVGEIRDELRAIGTVERVGGGQLRPGAGDLAVTAGWGYAGRGGITMPGKGRVEERAYTEAESAALATGVAELGLSAEDARLLLGESTFDVYLNNVACWRNVPGRVWEYTLGGYQVIKKWLSYRERPLLGRDLEPAEVREVRDIARRIAAILLLEPALDESYRAVREDCRD